MKTFEQWMLSERFENLFHLPKDIERKWQIVDQVWDMLQASYKYVGGIGGYGFESKEDMVQKIKFWKVAKVGGRIVAIQLYRTSDDRGRKTAVVATDGSEVGKKMLLQIVFEGLKFKRSWSEVSGKLWRFIVHNIPHALLKDSVIPIESVKHYIKDVSIIPAYGKDPSIKSDDPFRDYYYTRIIPCTDGECTKIAIGQPGVKVK